MKVTPVRLSILQLLQQHGYACGQNDIESELPDSDRVTIYRALRDLESSGILHAVTDKSGTKKFALCHADCEEGKHADHHVHFSCSDCGETYCLHHVEVPEIRNPRGYAVEQVALLMSGTCKSCLSAHK
ncbi:MAG: transcriptional repressor [Flavobacteriales bacterium]|nr:transcriptional repressor [Flavobacteriales bacterium]